MLTQQDNINFGDRMAGKGMPPRPQAIDPALQNSFISAKNAAGERVAQARMSLGAAQPMPRQVVDATKPRFDAGGSGGMGLATGLASSIIQSPAIAQQTNDALQRRGMKALIPQGPAGEMPIAQFANWVGGNDTTTPQQQPALNVALPAGAESTVRSPLAAPTPSYVQLDQPRESIPQPVAAQPAWGRQVDINDVQSGEGVMRNATGTYGYRQMPNGDLMKFDGQGNQVGKLGNVGSRQQAGGMRMTSYGAMTPVDNPLAYETERRMAERTAAAEEAKLARLEELAMTGGGGDGTFEGMGNQKRIRRGAQAALSERTGMRRAQMADASQREQMALTQRGYDQETQRATAKIDADMQLAALRQAAEDERTASTNKITQDMNLGTLQARQRELLIKESKQNNANRALKSAIDYYVASGMSQPEAERRAYLESNRGSLKLEE